MFAVLVVCVGVIEFGGCLIDCWLVWVGCFCLLVCSLEWFLVVFVWVWLFVCLVLLLELLCYLIGGVYCAACFASCCGVCLGFAGLGCRLVILLVIFGCLIIDFWLVFVCMLTCLLGGLLVLMVWCVYLVCSVLRYKFGHFFIWFV